MPTAVFKKEYLKAMETLLQCDFDGTITSEDVCFMILDAYGNQDWRKLLEPYRESKITVAQFTSQAVRTIKADEQTLVRFVRDKAKLRPGFQALLDYCHRRSFRFVVVSNGLDFYIKTILSDIGAGDVEVFAAKTSFSFDSLRVRYLDPRGKQLEDKFKEAYISSFRKNGYRIIYVGNGLSDIAPAKKADHVFATSELLTGCKKMNIACTPFNDLNDVVRGLEFLKQ